jgi:hypothetical protein
VLHRLIQVSQGRQTTKNFPLLVRARFGIVMDSHRKLRHILKSQRQIRSINGQGQAEQTAVRWPIGRKGHKRIQRLTHSTCAHGGVYLVDVHFTYTGVHLTGMCLMSVYLIGVISWTYISLACISHRRAPHRRASLTGVHLMGEHHGIVPIARRKGTSSRPLSVTPQPMSPKGSSMPHSL